MYSLAIIASHAEALCFAQGAASVLVGALFVTKVVTETMLKLLQYISTILEQFFRGVLAISAIVPLIFVISPF